VKINKPTDWSKTTNIFWFFVVYTFLGLAQAADFFVATTGNDNNNGSENTPWKTIQTSFTKLNPGDTLNIADGIYQENLVPNIRGTEQAPIVIRAINPLAAIIDGGGSSSALNIGGVKNGTPRKVSYVTFEGLKLRNAGPNKTVLLINSKDDQPATGNMDTHHVILKKIAVQGSCTLKNCNSLHIARANDVLLEDVWVYGAGRYSFLTYGSRNVTARRMVIRWDFWDGANDKPNDPRITMGVYNTHDSLFENIIIIDSGKKPIIDGVQRGGDKRAFGLAGGNNGLSAPFKSAKNNRFYGFVVFNNIGSVGWESRAVPHDNNLFENSVVYGNSIRGLTLNKKITNNTFNHLTIVNNTGGGYANHSSDQERFGNKVNNSIISNNGNPSGDAPIFIGNVEESYNMLFIPGLASDTNFGDNSIVLDPELLYLFKNDTTPLLDNLGSDGQRRGASLLFRYVDGAETDQNLWPWPYEDKIREDFCDSDVLTDWGRVNDNSSKWCDSEKSLTSYLWEALGNDLPDDLASIPAPKNVRSVKN